MRQRVPGLIPEAGALRLWWQELRDGIRTLHDRDFVFFAACAEARARDAVRLGLIVSANDDRRAAAAIIADAMARAA